MSAIEEESRALSMRWQRAALLGSLWAANEIVLGSFLHNIRLPFAGTVLATMAVALLVAGSRLWRDAGIIWRAGVVAALMKSISPSAVILGPMIGIMLEAFILAAAAGAFRHSAAGLIMGGMIATVTPLLQKIIALLLTYGMDAARMYASLFTFLTGVFHIEGPDPGSALFWFIALQAIPGAVAAAAGLAVARGVRTAETDPSSRAEDAIAMPDLLHSTGQNFSRALLVAHLLLMVAGLLTLPVLPPLVTPIPAALYLLAVLYRYPGVRPKFRRVRLWIDLAAVALLAGVLLGILAPGGNGTWWTGLLSGVVMTSRAVIVIAAFGAISIELRDPVIMAWFFKRGLGTLSAAMRVAFQALPSMLQGLSRERIGLHHPLRSTSRMLAFILRRLEEMNPPTQRATVYILTGRQGAGKTTLLARTVAALKEQHVHMHGFLSLVVLVDGLRAGYDIEILTDGERMPLCRTDRSMTGDQVGPFAFSREGVAAGLAALDGDGSGDACIWFVDEVGPLEMQGKGWAPALPDLLRRTTGTIVLVVRPDMVDTVQEHFGFSAANVWDVERLGAEEHRSITDELLRSVHIPSR